LPHGISAQVSDVDAASIVLADSNTEQIEND